MNRIYRSLEEFEKNMEWNNLNYSTIHTGSKRNGRNNSTAICAFDTETTSVIDEQHKASYVYIWSFDVYSNGVHYTLIERDINKLPKLLNLLSFVITKKSKQKNVSVLVGVHNLPYDFTFISKILLIDRLFAKSKRQPLMFDSGIFHFIDTLAISGMSLEKTGNAYTRTKKMAGDLDYTLARNTKTPLTMKEQRYCFNDVKVVTEYLEYLLMTYGVHGFFPTTKTSICRRTLKESFNREYPKKDRAEEVKDWLMRDLFPDTMQEYDCLIRWLFRGGYTHSNASKTGYVLENMKSKDFESSYPAWIAYERFPMSKPERVKSNEYESVIKSGVQWYGVFIFANITSKTQHSIESKHKCVSVLNPIIDNGRIKQAEKLVVMLTDLDWKIYCKFYDWSEVSCETLYRFPVSGKLPKYVINPLFNAYTEKTRLKNAGLDYKDQKAIVNSFYGMMVTTIPSENITYTDDWGSEPMTEDKRRDYARTTLLSPYWGIYTTAWARYHLLTDVFYNIGNDAVYGDTDSCKYLNPQKHEKVFEKFNRKMAKRRYKFCTENGFDVALMGHLGELTDDGTIVKFKTLGAKRYLVLNDHGNLECTVAGLPKRAFNRYLHQNKVSDLKEVFDRFDFGLKIKDCKNAHAYVDNVTDVITDFNGVSEEMHSGSACVIYPIDFEMKETDYTEFLAWLLKNLERGVVR